MSVDISTQEIMKTLWNEGTIVTARDVHSFRENVWTEFLHGKAPLQALLDEMRDSNKWIYETAFMSLIIASPAFFCT